MATGPFRNQWQRSRKDVFTVNLPYVFTRDSLYILVANLFKGLTLKPRKVVLDFKNLNSIQVGGVTVLSNMIELYKKTGIKTEFINATSCGAKSFLAGAGFSALYLNLGLDQVNKNEFLPLKLVEYQKSHSYLHDELVPWLAKILGAEIRALATLRVCYEEIFNNIKDHSTVNVGCSCAHYNEGNGEITICISDFGVGIPNKVKASIKTSTEMISDHGAIAMACQEGFTTRSTPGNMGAGLHVLIRNVVTRNSGSVRIYSGTGIYTCAPDQSGKVMKRSGRSAPEDSLYPGTLIYVKLDTKKFVPSEVDEEEFVWE